MNFRGRALRELAAPEQLDRAVRLAGVPAWLIALALTFAVGSAGVWAVVGTVPRVISAPGVLTHTAGVAELDASTGGRISRVWVHADDRVAKGDLLYTVVDGNGVVHNEPSPWDAHVVELLVGEGQLLAVGERTAALERLDSPGDTLQARVFVPAAGAPLLRPGAAVELEVASVPASAFGTLGGVVTSVGSFPETERSLRAFLGADRDVSGLLAGGDPIPVTVALDPDASAPTGYRWSKGGPPFGLTSQTALTATFTVTEEHPIQWLVRRW